MASGDPIPSRAAARLQGGHRLHTVLQRTRRRLSTCIMPCPRDDQFGFMVRFSRPTRSPSVESARGAPRSAPATSGRRPRRCSQRRRSTTMCAVRPRERISSSLLTPRRRWTARRVRDAESRACFPDSNDASTTGAVFLRGAILRVLSMHARFEGPIWIRFFLQLFVEERKNR
jgi:hypothetical protein